MLTKMPQQVYAYGDKQPIADAHLKLNRPRSQSSHSTGSSESCVESNYSGSGKLSPSLSASEEELNYYFFDEQHSGGFEQPAPQVPQVPVEPSAWVPSVPSAMPPPPMYAMPGGYNTIGYGHPQHSAGSTTYYHHPAHMIPQIPGYPSVAGGYMWNGQPEPALVPPAHVPPQFAGYGGAMMPPVIHQRSRRSSSGSSSTSTGSVRRPQSTAAATTHSHDRHLYAFQRDGSLRLQEFIPSASTEQRQNILADLHDQLPQLSRTPYGNYVVQKLIQHGTPQQRLAIVQALKHHFESLATDLYGHRVVSKALEYGDDTCKSIILGSLLASFKDIVNDEHGNYVAQKCIKTLATYQCEAIWEKFFGRVWITATHKFGHCVLKTLFLYAPNDVKDRILEEISKNVILLAKDPYGNYVLQHILDKEQYGDLLPRHNIIGALLDQFDDLSCNKFASNVVEKCLRCADAEHFSTLVVRFTSTSNKKLGKLINNPFGNYVVKTLLNLCTEEQKDRIRNRCVRIYQRIRCSCAVPAIFGERRVELEREFRMRRPDVCDDDEDEDDIESHSSGSLVRGFHDMNM